jgi:hypothetical protein
MTATREDFQPRGGRNITGILGRLEDPADGAGMTNPPGADLGARQGTRGARTWLLLIYAKSARDNLPASVLNAARETIEDAKD